jgi:hypothetical protein
MIPEGEENLQPVGESESLRAVFARGSRVCIDLVVRRETTQDGDSLAVFLLQMERETEL